MTDLEDRVARLEQRLDSLERIEKELGHIDEGVTTLALGFRDLRSDFNAYRAENGAVLERILATLQDLQRRPFVFRWPWEPLR
jgi:hypothetical protein